MKLLFAWSVCNSLHLSAIYHDVISIGLQCLEPISMDCDVMMYKKFESKNLKQLYLYPGQSKPQLKILNKVDRLFQTPGSLSDFVHQTFWVLFKNLHHLMSPPLSFMKIGRRSISTTGFFEKPCVDNRGESWYQDQDPAVRSQKTRIWERHESAQMIPGSPVPSSLSQIQGHMKTSFYPVWSRSRARGDREVFSQILGSVCWVGGQMGGSGQDTPTSPYCQTHVSHMLLNMWQSWRTTHDLLQSPTVWPDALVSVGELVAHQLWSTVLPCAVLSWDPSAPMCCWTCDNPYIEHMIYHTCDMTWYTTHVTTHDTPHMWQHMIYPTCDMTWKTPHVTWHDIPHMWHDMWQS